MMYTCLHPFCLLQCNSRVGGLLCDWSYRKLQNEGSSRSRDHSQRQLLERTAIFNQGILRCSEMNNSVFLQSTVCDGVDTGVYTRYNYYYVG